MNHIRHNFERAMNNHSSKLNEASERDYMVLAQSNKKEEKDQLFNLINQDLFGGQAPFERITLKDFNLGSMAKVEKILKKNPKAATVLTNLGGDVTGIGRGEIMLAYIVENLGIGGGAIDIDLTLYNDKGGILDQAELKEVKMSRDGFLYGWRTGARHRSIIDTAKNDLEALYQGLKDVLPELDVKTKGGAQIQSLVARGEGAAFIKLVKDMDPVVVQAPLSFEIAESPSGELVISKNGGDTIGDLKDAKTLDLIKGILAGQNVQTLKSYKNIEAELVAGFGNIKEKFVFVHTIGNNKKFGGIYYKDQISGKTADTKLDAWSGGTIKVRVKA